MGEKDDELVENGNVEMEEKTQPVEKTEEHHDGVKEMVKGNKVAKEVENNNMDKENVNASKETEEKAKSEHVVKEGGKDERMEETKEEEEKKQVAEEKVGMEIEEMNHGPSEKTEADDKVEDKVDGVGEEEKPKESKEERGRKNRLRTKSGDGKKRSVKQETEDKESNTQREKETKTSMDKKEEQKTPVALTIDRPVRERKSVERLVATIEQDAAKEFKVEKGRGTALKDIPNVAYKLSRKKSDGTFKLLHTILFGRRGKASQVKNNISRFSGFAWHDDEEKQKLKLKEKLDKIFKDKLAEFCDVLDISMSATIRKEDIISKLIEFLVAPHATTTELLAEKELSSKGKKRKRESKSASGSITPSESSAKSQKKTKCIPKKDNGPKPEDESLEETHDEDDKSNGLERLEDEKSEPAECEQKANESEESDKDKRKKKQGSAKSYAKKGTAEKAKTKKVTISKEDSLPPKKESLKSPSNHPKNNKDTSTKKSSGKKKDESVKENTSTPKKTSSSVSPGKKILKVKDNLREEKLKPSDNELRNAVCEILKEVDFNTATFTDILKLLAVRFNKDLMPRKPSIKLMIQDELTKIADAEEGDDEKDEGGVVKDGKNPSSQLVKA